MIADLVGPDAPLGGDLSVNSQSTRFRDGRVEAKAGEGSAVCYCFPGEANPPCRQAAAGGPRHNCVSGKP